MIYHDLSWSIMIYHVLSVLKFNLDLSLRPSTLLRSSWGLEAAREREREIEPEFLYLLITLSKLEDFLQRSWHCAEPDCIADTICSDKIMYWQNYRRAICIFWRGENVCGKSSTFCAEVEAAPGWTQKVGPVASKHNESQWVFDCVAGEHTAKWVGTLCLDSSKWDIWQQCLWRPDEIERIRLSTCCQSLNLSYLSWSIDINRLLPLFH